MSWFWREPPPEPKGQPLTEYVLERFMTEMAFVPTFSVFSKMHACIGELAELQPHYHPLFHDKVFEAFAVFADYLPKHYRVAPSELVAQFEEREKDPAAYDAQERDTFAVPLHDIIDDCGQAILDLVGPFFNKELVAQGLLPELRKQLLTNEAEASGFSYAERWHKKIVASDEYVGVPEEIVDAYLRWTPFWHLLKARVPFVVPRKTWASHGVILAPPGHGKTQLLGSLFATFLQEQNPVGAILLDPHGDLFEVAKDRVDPTRLILLDPDTNPPPLNFLDFGASTEAQTLQTFAYLMSSLSGGLSDKQGAIVPYLLKLLRNIEGASLETLRLIVDEKIKTPDRSTFKDAIAALPPVDQGFFRNQFYSNQMQQTKDAIGWKLYSALSSDAFRKMFSAKANSFDADAAMRERKVVLVKGARQALGDDGMSVFLQFIVSQFFSAALRRERIHPDKRHLCILFVDEAHHVFNSQTANILTECRKYGLGFLAATQVVQQIPDDVKAAIYGATAIKIAGPVSYSDAQILAREMYTTGDFIRSMKARERESADFAFYVTGMTDRAVKVTVPYGALESVPRVDRSPVPPVPTPPEAQPAMPVPASSADVNFPLPHHATDPAQSHKPDDSADPLIQPGKDW